MPNNLENINSNVTTLHTDLNSVLHTSKQHHRTKPHFFLYVVKQTPHKIQIKYE